MIDQDVLRHDFSAHLQQIADFTNDELIPAEAEMVGTGAVPERILHRMAALGLFGISIPRRYGGLEWTMEQQVRLTFEFTRASCVYRSRFSTVIGLCSQAILDHGTEAQRQQLLPAMAAGDLVMAFALTEEEAGSDAAHLRTTAIRDGGDYLVNGRKRYITNGAWADAFLTFARTDPGEPGAAGVSALIVDARSPGISTELPRYMNGHAEAPVAEIGFHDVRVGAQRLLGDVEGRGLTMALRGINHARLHVAATCVGQATRMLEETTAHVNGREQFGGPLADLGAVRSTLGESYAELEAGRALVVECARTFDRGEIPRHRIAAAKLYCSEMASAVADRCVQLLGGAGIVGPHPVPRMWRDVRALRIYEGSSPIHQRNLGRAMIEQVGADGTLPDTFRS
ncbi:acyl-CoA/acyl-ACP dehydrogenase [Saccharopolyspora indica]|uniref:acyl-CoA dehydrogenase family protein n=1 Tax=Saccharopolyspora indica TaxID=1229659 RepID=UPI0022EB79CE|nr:acyl-CoA dehydrogenase family protein [Saccharopolyspora indica]MDA3642813.1 acyl-CoA/acyl-ACP dehydrogenase [Saccharopolyspora indica]